MQSGKPNQLANRLVRTRHRDADASIPFTFMHLVIPGPPNATYFLAAISLTLRRAASMPIRAHQPMFQGSLSVVFSGVSPAE